MNKGSKAIILLALVGGMLLSATPLGLDPWNGLLGNDDDASSGSVDGITADTTAPTILSVIRTPIDPSGKSTVNVTSLVSDMSNLTVTTRYGFDNSTWTDLTPNQGLQNHTYEERVPSSGYSQTKLERTYALTGNLTYLNVFCSNSHRSMWCQIDVYHESDDEWSMVWHQAFRGYPPDVGTKVNLHFPDSNVTKWRITLYDFDNSDADFYYNYTARVLERAYWSDIPPAGTQDKVYYYVNVTDVAGNAVDSQVYNYTIDRTAPTLKDFSDLKGLKRSGTPIPIYTNFTDDRRVASARMNWSYDNATWHSVDMAKVSGSITSGEFKGTIPVPSQNTSCYYWVKVIDDGGNQANSTVRTFRWNPPPRFGGISQDPLHPNNTTKVNVTALVTDTNSVASVKVQYSGLPISWSEVNATSSGNNWTGQIPAIAGERWVSVRFKAWDSEGGVNTSQVYQYYVDEEKPSIYRIERSPDFPGNNDTVNVSTFIKDQSLPMNVTLQYSYDMLNWTNRSMTDLSGYRTYSYRYPANGTVKGSHGWQTYDLHGELQHLWIWGWSEDGERLHIDIEGYNETEGEWERITYITGTWTGPPVKFDTNLSHMGYTKVRIDFFDWNTYQYWYYKTVITVREDRYNATIPPSGEETSVFFRIKAVDAAGLTTYSAVKYFDIDTTAPTIENHTSPTVWRSTEPLYIYCNVSDDKRVMSAFINWSADNTTWQVDRMSFISGTDTLKEFRASLPPPSNNTTYYFQIFAYDEPYIMGNSSAYSFYWNPPPWIENITHSPFYVNHTSQVEVSADLWDKGGVSAMWVMYSADKTNWSRVNGTLSTGKWRATVPAHNGTEWVYYHVWAEETDGGRNESEEQEYPVDSNPPEFHDVSTVPTMVNHTTSPTLLAGVTDLVGINNTTMDYRFNWSAGWTTLDLKPPSPLASNLSVSGVSSWSMYGMEFFASRMGYYDKTIGGSFEYEIPEWALPYYTDVVVIQNYRSSAPPLAIEAADAGSYVLVSWSLWNAVLKELDTTSYLTYAANNHTSRGIPVGRGAIIQMTTYGFGNPITGFRAANATRLDNLVLHMRSAYLVYAPQRVTIPQTGNQTTVFYQVQCTDISRITNSTGILNYTTDGVAPTVNAAQGAPAPPYWGENDPYPVWINASDDRQVKGAKIVWSFDQGNNWLEKWLPRSRGNDTTRNITGSVPAPGSLTKVYFYYRVYDEALNHVRYPAGTTYFEYGTSDTPVFADLAHDTDWVLENQLTHITVNVTDFDGVDQVVLQYRLDLDEWTEVGMAHVLGPTWRGFITSPSSSGRMLYKVWAKDALGVENESQVQFYWVEGSGPYLYLTHIEPTYPGSNDSVTVHGNAIDRISNVTAWYDYRYGETGTVSTLNATGGATVSGTVTPPSTYGAMEYTHDLGKELTHLTITGRGSNSYTNTLRIEGYIEELDAWETVLFAENTTGDGTLLDMDLKGYGFTKWRMYFKHAGGSYVRASATYTAIDPEYTAQVPPPGNATWVYYRLRAIDPWGHGSTTEWGRYWADGVLPWLVNHTTPSNASSITGVNVTATFTDDTRINRAELHYDIGLGYHSLAMTKQDFNGTHLTANATIPPTYIPMNVTYYFRMYDEPGNFNDSRNFTVQTALLDAREGSTYWFNASRLMNSSDIKTVAWDLDYGGTFGADKTGVNVSHSFLDNGTLKMAVRITDNSDKNSTWVFNVTVLDESPTAIIRHFQPLKEGNQGDFEGHWSTTPADAIVKYEWDFDYDGNFTVDLTGIKVMHTYMDDGYYLVALRVTDDDGSISIDTRERYVEDQYPNIRISYPQQAYQGTVVEFNANRSWSNPDAIVSYLWDFDYNEWTPEVMASGPVVNYTYMVEGEYEVRLQVTDDDGSMRSVTFTIKILDGIPIANITIEGQPVEGHAFTLNASASKSYPDALVSYEWDLSFSGIFVTEAVGPLVNLTFMDSGGKWVALRLMDGDGSIVILERSIDVLDGVPTVYLDGPTTSYEGDLVQFNATRSTSYPDEIVTFEWDLDYRGTFDVDATGSLVNHTYMQDGDYTVALRVTDDDGSIVIENLNVTVFDLRPKPVIEVRWARVEGSELVFDGSNSTSYPDDIRTMEWDVDYVEGDFFPYLSGTKVFYTYLDSGIHVLALRVIDIDGSTVITTLALDIADLGPEVEITLSSELILEGSATTFGVDRIDMNPDDLVEFRWDWDGDGSVDVTTYEPNASHRFDMPGEWTMILEVMDEDGSIAHTYRTINVTNVGPIAIIQIEDAAEGQEVHLYGGDSQEPGDDIVEFRWDLDDDGEWDASTMGSINWTWYSSGTYPVVLEVEDEAGATHRVTGTVIISDVAPTADAGGPYEVSEGRPLLLSAKGSSEPGDNIIGYSWDMDGDGVKETTSDGPEIEHSWDEPGRYSLTLKVLDEDGSSGTTYFIVTVLDAPPTFDLVLPVNVMEGVAATFEVINLHDPGTETFAVTWHFGDDKKELGSSVVHTYASHGSYSGHVTVRDNEGTVARLDWPDPLVVASSSPIFTLDSYTWNLTEDETFTYDLVISAPYGSILTFSFEGPGGKLDPETGRFTWTPTDADVGNHTFTFFVEDEGGDGGTAQVKVSVEAVEQPPGEEPDGEDDPSGSTNAIYIAIIIGIIALVAVVVITLVLRRRTSIPTDGEGGMEGVEAMEIPQEDEGH